jgi:osmotically-inducible protein OsmY
MKLNVIVPDRKITVVANEGFVTLEGTVGWEYQSQGAERCARHAAGVRGVTNQITVKPRVSAAELSRRIEEGLHGKPEADSRRILVAAVDGKVYLYGSVHSSIEREKATQVARSGPGVAEVVDSLSVVP